MIQKHQLNFSPQYIGKDVYIPFAIVLIAYATQAIWALVAPLLTVSSCFILFNSLMKTVMGIQNPYFLPISHVMVPFHLGLFVVETILPLELTT